MYTKKDFRKDFPQNVMLTKVKNRAFLKDLIKFNFINCLFAAAQIGLTALLRNHIAPTDVYEYKLKVSQAEDLNQKYIDMREKYDVDHEDIVGLN